VTCNHKNINISLTGIETAGDSDSRTADGQLMGRAIC